MVEKVPVVSGKQRAKVKKAPAVFQKKFALKLGGAAIDADDLEERKPPEPVPEAITVVPEKKAFVRPQLRLGEP